MRMRLQQKVSGNQARRVVKYIFNNNLDGKRVCWQALSYRHAPTRSEVEASGPAATLARLHSLLSATGHMPCPRLEPQRAEGHACYDWAECQALSTHRPKV
jgi:hypothetical protein